METVDPKPEHIQGYTDWHWGIPPSSVVNWDDDDFPDDMIECGKLIELRFRRPNDLRDTRLRIKHPYTPTSHLAFDPSHESERLYILLHPKVQEAVKEKYWKDSPYTPTDLNTVARMAGGLHGKKADYRSNPVKPIGVMTGVVYGTEKKGDGYSYYIHRMGEESGVRPVLATDNRGRLWIAGGNYTSPTPGITD